MDKKQLEEIAKPYVWAAALTPAIPVALPAYVAYRATIGATLGTINGLSAIGRAIGRGHSRRKEEAKRLAEQRREAAVQRRYLASLPKPKTKMDLYKDLKTAMDEDLRLADSIADAERMPDDERQELARLIRDGYERKFQDLFQVY